MKTKWMMTVLPSLLVLLSQTARAADPIFECSPATGETVQVFSDRNVPKDHWGRLLFSLGERLTVTVTGEHGEQRDYSALVLLVDNSGGVTKHAMMARYDLARGTLPRSLTLRLGGIDEFQDRETCAWNDNK